MNGINDDWKQRAQALFFVEHKTIEEIAAALSKDRKTIRQHLQACPGFEQEKLARKQATQERNRVYKAKWDRTKRKKPTTGSLGPYEDMLLTRRHNLDVKILSCERL